VEQFPQDDLAADAVPRCKIADGLVIQGGALNARIEIAIGYEELAGETVASDLDPPCVPL
jgi:hypothetical protein